MKKLFLVVVVIALAGLGYFFITDDSTPSSPEGATQKETPATSGLYTLAQIAEHATKDSCWMALEGKVYDVTPFVASGFHPGKDAILQGCGKDATELFNTRPTGSGTSHSERARKMLPKYYIGDLAQ